MDKNKNAEWFKEVRESLERILDKLKTLKELDQEIEESRKTCAQEPKEGLGGAQKTSSATNKHCDA